MRFALYHPWVYLRGGVERLLLETVERSRHDWTLWTHRYEPENTFSGFADLDVRELSPRVSVQRSLGPLMRASATIMRTELPVEDHRALLVSSESLGHLMLARNRLPSAAYCHTPLKILHDPVTRAALAERSQGQAAMLSVFGTGFSVMERRMWRRFDHVFANSRETLDRCRRAGLRPGGDADVLHPGVDLVRFRPDGHDREPFLLVAGRVMWQKNIGLAIEAVRELARRGRPTRLVVAGAVDMKSQPYLAQLRAQAAGLDIEFRVDPGDDELAELYRRCLGLVYTPWNEDFGMVPLEAMASGAPVLAVDSGGPRETVVHGETGWLAPNDPQVFADILESALSGSALERMRRPARLHAEWFTWDRVARRIDDVMETLAGAPHAHPVPPSATLSRLRSHVPAPAATPVPHSPASGTGEAAGIVTG